MPFKRVSFVCAAIAGTCAQAALALECANPSELVKQLDQAFSNTSAIGCIHSELQLENAQGYWGIQYAKNASIVVYPSTAEDVAAAIRVFINSPEAKGLDFAVGGGLHGRTYGVFLSRLSPVLGRCLLWGQPSGGGTMLSTLSIMLHQN